MRKRRQPRIPLLHTTATTISTIAPQSNSSTNHAAQGQSSITSVSRGWPPKGSKHEREVLLYGLGVLPHPPRDHCTTTNPNQPLAAPRCLPPARATSPNLIAHYTPSKLCYCSFASAYGAMAGGSSDIPPHRLSGSYP